MTEVPTTLPLYPFCPKCGNGNVGQTKFCTACGGPMAIREQTLHDLHIAPCPGCGKTSPRSVYCGYCSGRHEVTVMVPMPLVTATSDPFPGGLNMSAGHTAAMGSVAVTLHDGSRGPTYPISLVDKTVIGRNLGQMKFPEDTFLSPRHLEIAGQGDHVSVTDLDSLNGSYIRLQTPTLVPAGNTILIGRQYLRVRPMELRPSVQDPDGTQLVGSDTPAVLWAVERLMPNGMVRDVYALPGPHVTFGRHGTDVLFPHDTFVSGKHARLAPKSEGVQVTDLDSSNGSWIRMLGPSVLHHGAQLMLGRTRLTLMLPHS